MTAAHLSHLATPGTHVPVRVTPKASSNRNVEQDAQLRIYVTAAPEGGKANEAVRKLLAGAMGVPESRLTLIRGQAARDKVFQVD